MAGSDKSLMGRGSQMYQGKNVKYMKPTQDGAMQYTPGKTHADQMTFARTQHNSAMSATSRAATDIKVSDKEFKKKLKAERMVFDSFISSVHSK